jgi:hypothetical protein
MLACRLHSTSSILLLKRWVLWVMKQVLVRRIVHQLVRRIMIVTGERQATEFLFPRVSVAIERVNAFCVHGTCNSSMDSQNLDVVYYL